MAYRIHIKHKMKGKIAVRNLHVQEFDLESEREMAYQNALVSCMMTRTEPLPDVKPSEPVNGYYPTLTKELELRQARNEEAAFLPWPVMPEQGVYGRKNLEADLHCINNWEANITADIAAGRRQATECMKAYHMAEVMRANCKKALMRTVSILQGSDKEKATKGFRPTLRGILLTPQQAENIRRLATDKNYLLRLMSEKEKSKP